CPIAWFHCGSSEGQRAALRPPGEWLDGDEEKNMNIAKCLLPLIAATCVLFAQTDRGTIEGTVKDPNGAIVPGAKVQVVNIETNSKLDFESNELGHYLAASLPVGSYRLVVQREGFRTAIREPILV